MDPASGNGLFVGLRWNRRPRIRMFCGCIGIDLLLCCIRREFLSGLLDEELLELGRFRELWSR